MIHCKIQPHIKKNIHTHTHIHTYTHSISWRNLGGGVTRACGCRTGGLWLQTLCKLELDLSPFPPGGAHLLPNDQYCLLS